MIPETLDWRNPQALLDHIVSSRFTAEPLVLERLFEHCGLEEIGSLPTLNQWTAVTWAHKARERFAILRPYHFVVQHPITLPPTVVIPHLAGLSMAVRDAIACGAGAPALTFQLPVPEQD